MTIVPINTVLESGAPMPRSPKVIAADILSHILGPCLQSFLNTQRKDPFSSLDVNLPVDLIDEQVNQTAVDNMGNNIRENAEADEEAFIELSEQRQSRT